MSERTTGQYSESVRILIADLQTNDDESVKKQRAFRIRELAKQYENVPKTRRELLLIALDLDPENNEQVVPEKNLTSLDRPEQKYELAIRYLFDNAHPIPEDVKIIIEETFPGSKHVVAELDPNQYTTFQSLIDKVIELSCGIQEYQYTWSIVHSGHRLIAKGEIASFAQQNQTSQYQVSSPSGAVRKVMPISKARVNRIPVSQPKQAQARQAQATKFDPASYVIQNTKEKQLIVKIAPRCKTFCDKLVERYAAMEFGEGFYPFPSNPVREIEQDGNIIRVIFLSWAQVLFDSKPHFLWCEIDGKPVKTKGHPRMIKMQDGSPCVSVVRTSDQLRACGAFEYKDGTVIRYWLKDRSKEIGDVEESRCFYRISGSSIEMISRNDYDEIIKHKR